MRALIVCITMLIGSLTMAQNNQEAISKAISAYNEKEYAVAIDLWKNVLKNYPDNANLHYNLANAYYQNTQTGLSIYHYEKALKIKPDFVQAQINLEFAQKLKIDKFKGQFSLSQSEIFYNIFDFLSINTWAVLSIIFSVVTFIVFGVYYLNNNSRTKKISFSLMFVFLFLSMVSVLITSMQKSFLNKSSFGIVIPKEVLLKEQPRASSKTVLKIHEGSKVVIDETSDKWYKIRLVNDTLGWINKEEIKEL